MDDIKEKIPFQWILNRIQTFKYLVVAVILIMMAYTANAIDITNDFKSLVLLIATSILLLISFYISVKDAYSSLFFNEESQENDLKVSRYIVFTLIFISAVLIFVAKILNAVTMINANTAIMG